MSVSYIREHQICFKSIVWFFMYLFGFFFALLCFFFMHYFFFATVAKLLFWLCWFAHLFNILFNIRYARNIQLQFNVSMKKLTELGDSCLKHFCQISSSLRSDSLIKFYEKSKPLQSALSSFKKLDWWRL